MDPLIKEKSWTKEAEAAICKKWVAEEPYRFDKLSNKPVYSIDTPPPYLNTPIHMGHATTYTLMDMFARFRRMSGFNVLFPLGLDNNGLPIEVAAEKKFGVRLGGVSREEFIGLCRKVLEESGDISVNSFQRLGIGFNSWKRGTGIGEVYETDSPDYRSLTQETFIDLWNRKLIYEDDRINNYCPGCQTTLADADIEYADLPTNFNDLIFTVKETGEKIIIGTTRPELICSCAMVIFHPDDGRHSRLNGKTAITPLYNKEVPIKAHPSASMEKGTGLVMMCSMGDTADIRFFREMKLEPVIAIDADGRMNGNAGFLAGMKVSEAKKAIIERLRADGLLVRQTPTNHRTPVCERSKEPIEFISMREFYMKQLDFKDKIKVLAKKLKFYSDSSRQIMLDWIEAISIDWPISRRRYYATEIPLWYCKKCGAAFVPPKGRYYQPWREKPPVDKCSCGSPDFVGEERVLDTWFDSSNTPLYILKYSRDDAFFKKNSQCTLRPQGKEIIRTWLYYTVLKCYLLTGKLIFRDAWINYHVIDESGLKMSKSKGNIIDPQEILNRQGTEPFRLWCAVEGNLVTTDFRCSFERIEGAGKTIVKLWNVARFISMFPYAEIDEEKLQPLDRWILGEASSIAAFAARQYEKYDFHNPVIRARHFIWETFASHYMELVKNRAYNNDGRFSEDEQKAAIYALHSCLDTILKVLAPVIPMVTYSIYSQLRNKDIHFEEFPKPSKKKAGEAGKTGKSGKGKPRFSTAAIEALDSVIWKAKKDKGLSLKAEVKSATIPRKFKSVEKDLVAAHNIKSVRWGKEVMVEV